MQGGCFCGQVRYEVTGRPFNATLCHCIDCRRVAGAPAVAWFTVDPAEYRLTAGAPTVFQSSAKAARSFCPACGTGLTFRHADFPGQIDVATCTLDQPDQVPPADHCYAGQALPWAELQDGLPRHRTTRPAPCAA